MAIAVEILRSSNWYVLVCFWFSSDTQITREKVTEKYLQYFAVVSNVMDWNITGDPRQLLGQRGVDYEERINWERLRSERLEKLQNAMKDAGVGSLLLYKESNIRYATGTHWLEAFSSRIFHRYTLVPEDGDPVLFEYPGIEERNRKIHSPWVVEKMKPCIIWDKHGQALEHRVNSWADDLVETMEEEGVAKEPLGVDMADVHMMGALNDRNVDVVDAKSIVEDATKIKTKDEIEACKQITSIVDAGMHEAKEMLKPGVRECDIAGRLLDTWTSMGAEAIQCIVVASGGRTKPYSREFTDKRVRQGDLLILDEGGLTGPAGMKGDYVRTYYCGENPPQELKDAHRECYDYLWDAIDAVEPGATTADIAEQFPTGVDEEHDTLSMIQYGHGLGIHIPATPIISRGHSMEYPEEIKEGMYMAIETYVPTEHQSVRLEENFVVTDEGAEVFSLAPYDTKLMDEPYQRHK